MATRMQQRRGTAAQWISTNGGAGPVLNAGEMGWESDTNKFKIGDGVNNWTSLDYFSDINSTVDPAFGSSITFEGATANAFETTLTVTDPTADRTITIPDVTGTVITTGNLSDITNIGVFTSTITMEGSTANDFELTISAGDPTADRTVTFPDATGTVALLTATQTFTNSKLTGSSYDSNIVDPTLLGALKLEGGSYGVTIASSGDRENFKTWSFGTDGVLSAPGNIIFEGATANDYETTLAITDPTADRTITLPDATGTVALEANVAALAGATFTGAVSGTDLTLSGNLTVNGTTTNINSTNLVVEDKNIVLADVETPTDTTADGGGITLKGATDKTFNWLDATDSWTSSEHLTLNATKELRLADTDSTHYVGFKSPGTVTANKIWTLPSEDGTANQVLKTDGSGTLSWATAGGGGAAFSELMLIGA